MANRSGFLGVKDADGSSELDRPDPQSDGSDSDEGYTSEPGDSEDENMGANDAIQNYIDYLGYLEEVSSLPRTLRVEALRELLTKIGKELHH